MVFRYLRPVFHSENCYRFMTIGDKQMLMKKIGSTYREIAGLFAPVEPIITVPAQRPAANASSFVRTDVQARRQRRQRRLDRGMSRGMSGWAVRTW
jgi:hypothetical protein